MNYLHSHIDCDYGGRFPCIPLHSGQNSNDSLWIHGFRC